MERNNYYNKECFRLVKVKFSEHSTGRYTFVTHVSQDVKVGDIVMVLTGDDSLDAENGYEWVKSVKVTGITSNMKYLPKDYDIKPIICKLNDELYKKLNNGFNKTSKRSKEKTTA